MVVQHGGQQVVGRADGVEIAGEVEVDVLHGHHLRVAAARRAALDAEHRAEGRLAQGDDAVFTDAPQSIGEADGRSGLALARRSGGDGGDEHKPAVRFRCIQEGKVDLGLVIAVLFEILFRHARAFGDFADVQHFGLLGDLYVAEHRTPP